MRSIPIAALLIVVATAPASGDMVKGSYTSLWFDDAGDDPIVLNALKTEYRWGRFKHVDASGTSLVCRGWCYGDPADVLSIGGVGDVQRTVVRTAGGEPFGVSLTWTNGSYSLACFGSNAATQSSSTCVRRSRERVKKETYYPGSVEIVDGIASVDGCVTEVACDLCEGDDLCAGRTPIAYGTGHLETVARYTSQRQNSGPFPTFGAPFSEPYLPLNQLGIP